MSAFLLLSFAFACFALSPAAQAITPPPDGGYLGQNTAEGDDALFSLDATQGFNSTAIGFDALCGNTTGGRTRPTAPGRSITPPPPMNNTATGDYALYSNMTGAQNTAIGANALILNITGKNNTGIGYQAFVHNTGSFNIAIGYGAGGKLTTRVNNIDIGNGGVMAETKTIRIGNPTNQMHTFIAGISGVTVAGGVGVVVDSSGHPGTRTSSARFKDAIKPMNKASEAILALKPVTFHYKHELDPKGVPQFGLLVEDVEKVNSDLVARNEQGKPYTVRYDAVNAILLNEFLKEHREVEQLEKQVEALTWPTESERTA